MWAQGTPPAGEREVFEAVVPLETATGCYTRGDVVLVSSRGSFVLIFDRRDQEATKIIRPKLEQSGRFHKPVDLDQVTGITRTSKVCYWPITPCRNFIRFLRLLVSVGTKPDLSGVRTISL